MGITGLHPIIKPILKRKHISSYKNTRMGVDGHAWLYKFAVHIAEELFYNLPTEKHLKMLENKIKIFEKNKIDLVFVFDGENLESKEKTLLERSRRKKEAREEVELLLKNNEVARAKEKMKSCVHISDNIFESVIRFLRARNIECLVSPYESDAQLTYLQRTDYIEYILSEDSDLVIYGCTNVLYKFDTSHVFEYKKENLMNAWDNFFVKNIVDIAILSGCDYLEGLKGIGLKKAYKLLKQHGSVKEAVFQHGIKNEVPDNYLYEHERASLTFMHQIVYDVKLKKRVHLSGEEKKIFSFLGKFMENEQDFSEFRNLDKKGPIIDFCRRIDYVSEKKEVTVEKRVRSKKIMKEKIKIVDKNERTPYFNDD